jgi:hypothetical protein
MWDCLAGGRDGWLGSRINGSQHGSQSKGVPVNVVVQTGVCRNDQKVWVQKRDKGSVQRGERERNFERTNESEAGKYLADSAEDVQ